MKQRIRVVGIIRKDDRVLVFKRNLGRVEMTPTWELPTGKIKFGEQPEEAIVRVLFEELGVKSDDVKLKDVITFTALAGSNRLYNLYIVYDMVITEDIKLRSTERYTQFKYVKFGEETMRFDDASLSVLEIEMPQAAGEISHADIKDAVTGATVYIDGGSRGNPGPSGIGYYIVDEAGHELAKGGEFIGFATSRVAEYYALKEGCEQAIELGLKSVRFVSDNLMMVNQMNGIYKVKNKDLVPIYNDIQKLLKNFDRVAFVQVNREYNKVADREVNIAINKHFDIPEDEAAKNPNLFSHIDE